MLRFGCGGTGLNSRPLSCEVLGKRVINLG